jgi:hypothetical protein
MQPNDKHKVAFMNYRKIWEDAYGPIPTDSCGRSYEIHHKDGNRSNNNIDNLQCISIEDHLSIHEQQGDVGACIAIRMRIDQDHRELKKLASEWSKASNAVRVATGTHNFLSDKHRKNNRKRQLRLIEDGKHPFCEGQNDRGKKSYETKVDVWISSTDDDFIQLLKGYKWTIKRKLRDGSVQTKLNSMIIQAINTRYGSNINRKNQTMKHLEEFHNVNDTYRWS